MPVTAVGAGLSGLYTAHLVYVQPYILVWGLEAATSQINHG